jgi:hypothetical protein
MFVISPSCALCSATIEVKFSVYCCILVNACFWSSGDCQYIRVDQSSVPTFLWSLSTHFYSRSWSWMYAPCDSWYKFLSSEHGRNHVMCNCIRWYSFWFLTCVQKVPILNLVRDTGCPAVGFCRLLQWLQADVGMVPWNRSQPLPSTFPPYHNSIIILPSDIV